MEMQISMATLKCWRWIVGLQQSPWTFRHKRNGEACSRVSLGLWRHSWSIEPGDLSEKDFPHFPSLSRFSSLDTNIFQSLSILSSASSLFLRRQH